MAFFDQLHGSMLEQLKDRETTIEALLKKIKTLEDERITGK